MRDALIQGLLSSNLQAQPELDQHISNETKTKTVLWLTDDAFAISVETIDEKLVSTEIQDFQFYGCVDFGMCATVTSATEISSNHQTSATATPDVNDYHYIDFEGSGKSTWRKGLAVYARSACHFRDAMDVFVMRYRMDSDHESDFQPRLSFHGMSTDDWNDGIPFPVSSLRLGNMHPNNGSLVQLELSCVSLNEDQCRAVVACSPSLSLTLCSFTDGGTAFYQQLLATEKKCTDYQRTVTASYLHIFLQRICLSESALDLFATFLSCTARLKKLALVDMKWSSTDWAVIDQGMGQNTSLEQLDLTKSRFLASSLKKLQSHPSLATLVARHCVLTESLIRSLSNDSMRNLQVLDLSNVSVSAFTTQPSVKRGVYNSSLLNDLFDTLRKRERLHTINIGNMRMCYLLDRARKTMEFLLRVTSRLQMEQSIELGRLSSLFPELARDMKSTTTANRIRTWLKHGMLFSNGSISPNLICLVLRQRHWLTADENLTRNFLFLRNSTQCFIS